MPTQTALATLYFRRQITDSLGHDITADPVWFAFPARGVKPTDPDWVAATYMGPDEPNVWAVLVGPDGDKELDVGIYDVWQKVTDSPEVDAERVDVLQIT